MFGVPLEGETVVLDRSAGVAEDLAEPAAGMERAGIPLPGEAQALGEDPRRGLGSIGGPGVGVEDRQEGARQPEGALEVVLVGQGGDLEVAGGELVMAERRREIAPDPAGRDRLRIGLDRRPGGGERLLEPEIGLGEAGESRSGQRPGGGGGPGIGEHGLELAAGGIDLARLEPFPSPGGSIVAASRRLAGERTGAAFAPAGAPLPHRDRGGHDDRRRGDDRRRHPSAAVQRRRGARRARPDPLSGQEAAQVVPDLAGVPVPFARLLGEALPDDPVEVAVDARVELDQRPRLLGEDLHHEVEERVGLEGGPPGEDLVEERAEAVDVGVGADPVELPVGLLRCHVGGRPDQGPGLGQAFGTGEALGEPEVGDPRPSGPVDQHVGRLDVAVDDPLLVRVGQGVDDRQEDLDAGVRRGRRPLEPHVERDAVDVLHRVVEGVAVAPGGVDLDDVRVAEAAADLDLSLEPGQARRVGLAPAGEDLERDDAVHRRIEGPEDDAHPAPADLVQDAEGADPFRHLPEGGRGRLVVVVAQDLEGLPQQALRARDLVAGQRPLEVPILDAIPVGEGRDVVAGQVVRLERLLEEVDRRTGLPEMSRQPAGPALVEPEHLTAVGEEGFPVPRFHRADSSAITRRAQSSAQRSPGPDPEHRGRRSSVRVAPSRSSGSARTSRRRARSIDCRSTAGGGRAPSPRDPSC